MGFDGDVFADFAMKEAEKNLLWTAGGEAVKYTRPFEYLFGERRFPWCAAFVFYCFRNFDGCGLKMPPHVPGEPYTMAFCEQWQLWGKRLNFYHECCPEVRVQKDVGVYFGMTGRPRRGDIVLYDWQNGPLDHDWEDHMGICLECNGEIVTTAEGNVKNRSCVKTRSMRFVEGYIRIPKGWEYHAQD